MPAEAQQADHLANIQARVGQVLQHQVAVTDEVKGGNFRGMQLPIGIFPGMPLASLAS